LGPLIFLLFRCFITSIASLAKVFCCKILEYSVGYSPLIVLSLFFPCQ
jgi:hypothetical protein